VTGDLLAGLMTASVEDLADGAVLLRGFAVTEAPALLAEITAIAEAAPFRHLITPGGFRMSVAMTNCGAVGWISDRRGYRYGADDPETGRPWPDMPPLFRDLAGRAAQAAGFSGFAPEACLINRYAPGARLTLHQDRDEGNLSHPIVSVSLGVPATFLFGGLDRKDKPRRFRVDHGDVAVWGGPSRLAFHGVDALKQGHHDLTGQLRYNLTFRKAL
jgi:alkylated DNA repair protein (DNA oxidative demethylase)